MKRAVALAWIAWLGIAMPAAARDPGADGEFDRRRSRHFELHQDVDIDQRAGRSGSRAFEREVLAVLEDAYDRVADAIDVAPRRPVSVWIYDPAVFDAGVAGAVRFPLAGFYHGVIRVRGDQRVTRDLARVLAHEYVHAAFDATAPSLVLPAVFNEGMAEWLSRGGLDASELAILRRTAAAGALPTPDAMFAPSFGALDASGAPLAYLYATAFVERLARDHGEKSLRELVRILLRTDSLDQALERVYDADLGALDAALRAELAR